MKKPLSPPLSLSVLTALSALAVLPLHAAPLDDATALLQSKKYPEAAAAFAALPASPGDPGQVPYLHALSLHLAGKQDEAAAAADKVVPDSPWAYKAKFLKAAALTAAKKHKEAETIYAAEAARAFSPQRRDVLVKTLLEVAEEAVNPVAAGEVNPPQPDWKKAAALCEKVLDMPITGELRADVLYKKAGLLQKAGDNAGAHAAFHAWLMKFDTAWELGYPGGKKPASSTVLFNGKEADRLGARLHLAEGLLAMGRFPEARAAAKDLEQYFRKLPAGDYGKIDWAGDAAWLQVQTFAPKQSRDQQQEANQAPAQQRLQRAVTPPIETVPGPLPVLPGPQGEIGPSGPVGSLFEQFANAVPFPQLPATGYDSDDYLTQLRAFLTAHPSHRAAPEAAEAIAWTLDSGMSKDAEAISAWTDFIEAKAFKFDPNTEANRQPDKLTGLSPAESLLRRQQTAAFRIGRMHYDHHRYTEAIAQWRKYIAAHPNGREWQQAQSSIVDAEFQSGLTAVAAGDEKKAREIFDGFLARYPLDDRARRILFIYGQFHYAAGMALKGQPTDKTAPEFQLAINEWARLTGKYPNTEESSLALYNTALIISDEFGRLEEGLAVFKRVTWGQWAGPAKQRVDLMSSKSLAVAGERVFRLNETPSVKVSLRNIEKLRISRYPLDVEAFFRSRHRVDAIDLLDIDLIAPDKTWEVAVKDFARYRSIQQDIPVEFPEGKAGAYIVRVEGDDWQATTLLVRSDIDVLVETARREVLTYVMRGPDKTPVANATVLLSDGQRIIATGQTGPDGVFRAKPEGIEKAGTVRAFVSSPQGMAGSFLETSGLALSTAPEKMSRVFFHRSSYAPGDTVHWQAIRRDLKDGTFPVSPAGDDWKWRAQLGDGRLLYEGTITWSPLGLCSGSFVLPPSAPAGSDGAYYKVSVFNAKETVAGRFYVSDSTENDPVNGYEERVMERSAYLAGEKVRGRFRLAWRNGLPRRDEEQLLQFTDGRVEKVKSDSDGNIPFEVDTKDLKPGTHAVTLMHPRGGAPATFTFSVYENEFSLTFGKLPEVVLAAEAFDLKAIASQFNGSAYSGTVKLSVQRREAAKPSRVLEGVPWISGFVNEPVNTPVSEVEIKTGDNGEAVQSVTLPQPGEYILKLSGKDKQGHDITAETTLRAAGGDDDSKLRLIAPNVPLIAGETLKLRVQSAVAHPNALVTVHAQDFFSHRLVALKAGANELEVPVAAAFAPNFRVTVAVIDGRNVQVASRPFEVRSGLKVTLTQEPDGVTVKTTDLSGKPVAAHLITNTSASAKGIPSRAGGATVIPLRATGLSIESSAAFSHTGASLRKVGDKFVAAVNDQMLMCTIQQTEISFNEANTLLLDNNRDFMGGNTFLTAAKAQKQGVFVINPGLSTMKRDALGLDVSLGSSGIPDIVWTPHEPVRGAPEGIDSRPVLARTFVAQEAGAVDSAVIQQFDTDATGTKKLTGLDVQRGMQATVLALDGTSLVAADTLVIPSSAKVEVRALLPDALTPGQTYSFPVFVRNLTKESLQGLTAQVSIGGETQSAALADLGSAQDMVRWLENLTAPKSPGTLPVKITVAGVSWESTLTTRTLNVASVLPAGGLFGQGEHTFTLPAAEGVIGYRLIKSADVASFPGASLNVTGESNDQSEPQNTASDLLHVLSALAAAKDDTKPALQARLAFLTAELAATEQEGGWTWENINISPGLLTTAFTWRALIEAKAAGVVVSDMMLKRAAAFVAGRYRGIGATDFERKATTLQAMAAGGKADFSLLNPLYRSRETLTPVALSRLCAAFIHAGREDEAKEVLTLLLKTGTAGKTAAGEDFLYWPGSKGVAGLNAPEESTAAALWCAAKLNPAAPEARRIALWLVNSQAAAPGGTTRCRGQVMQALAEYAKSLPRANAGDTVEVLANGQVINAQPGDILPVPADGKVTIRVKGAAPAVVIAAAVRETPPDDPKSWEYPKIGARTYLHDNFRAGDVVLGAASTTPVIQAAHGQLIRVVVKIQNHPDDTWKSHGNFLQVDEEIPAGCLFVEGSLRHNASRVEVHGNKLRFLYGPGTMEDISYNVIALAPGIWTSRAAVLADPYDPARCRRGAGNTLTILPPGTPSPDVYQTNRAEHHELARLAFARNDGAECLKHLDALAGGRMSQDEEQDTARMRLWILAGNENGDAKALIGAFELLTERHTRLLIPFEKLLRVGAAYRRLNEFERAATIFRAALDGAFLQDSTLGAALEDAGDFIGGVNLQEQLWREYPDSKDVMDSLTGLAQSLSSKAPGADKLPVRRNQPKLEKNALLTRSRDLLQRFVTLYPADEQSDDAAFSIVNVYFSLKDYPGMVNAATVSAERYAGSTFTDGFKYMAALGWFWQGQFDKALAAAAPVANGESKDRDYARYVTAQVYHAQGKTAEAIEWYQKVKTAYDDAAEAIAWFEQKKVGLPEVTIFKPGEPVKLALDYRNVKEGAVQIYKVDLMKLYLREKSLSNITRVNLAGIAPQAGEAFPLGEGKDYVMKKKELTLPLKDEGAYLAIFRGDNLFTSGLLLITPLKLEVKENRSGSVRVNVSDAANGNALADAEVKALGSQSQQVQSGATDPRGVFEAGSISGTSTVIVKQGENRYAFHRGTVSLGSATPSMQSNLRNGVTPEPAASKPKVLEKGDYFKNIDASNGMIQQQQINNWEGKRRGNAKGVEAGQALKK